MKSHRCLCNFTFHPDCRVDHVGEAERAESAIESLIRMPAFIAGAYTAITQDELDEFGFRMADADYIAAGQVYDRVARRVAHTDIDQLIALTKPSPLPRDQAAGELLAKYERFIRSADIPSVATPGASAERSTFASDGYVTPTAGAFLSTDRRNAA